MKGIKTAESDRGATNSATAAPPVMYREGPYLKVLLALLMSVTIFEGYDNTITQLLLESGKGKRKHSDIKLQTVKQMA